MATTVMSDLNTLPKFYSKVWLEVLNPGPAIMEFATKKKLEQGSGNNIFFPRAVARSTVVSAALQTDGTVMTTQKFVDAQVSAVIQQFGDGVAMSDLTNLTALNSTVTEATKSLGIQAKNVIDKRILEGCYNTSATATGAGFSMFFYNTVGNSQLGISTSAGFTYADETEYAIKAETLRAASGVLRSRNVEPFEDGMFALIAHSDTASRLRADSEWQNAFIYTDAESVRKGIASAYEGVKIVIDNNVTTSANGSVGATLYYSVLLGRGAIGATELDGGVKFFAKKPGSSTTNDPADQFITLAWKANFTSKILNVSSGLVVITADA